MDQYFKLIYCAELFVSFTRYMYNTVCLNTVEKFESVKVFITLYFIYILYVLSTLYIYCSIDAHLFVLIRPVTRL